jgi:hypothetical protein
MAIDRVMSRCDGNKTAPCKASILGYAVMAGGQRRRGTWRLWQSFGVFDTVGIQHLAGNKQREPTSCQGGKVFVAAGGPLLGI